MDIPIHVFPDLKEWLDEQHIAVPLDWVEACVEFLFTEHTDLKLDASLCTLKHLVRTHWLESNLEEIEFSYLPPELGSKPQTSFTLNYALQVNGVYDIGKSAYSQMRELEGTVNANENVSAAPKEPLPKWETKPTRMLMLNLTDGVNVVQGMEYKPIPCLSPDLRPGIKVLICGPVRCRFGILLLTEDKIKVLGGSFDDSWKYSRVEILKGLLHLENGDRTPLTNEDSQGNASNPIPISRNTPVNSRNHVPHQTTDFSNSVLLYGNQPLLTDMQRSAASSIDLIDDFDCGDDDDFVQNLDYDALDEIEKKSSQLMSSSSSIQELHLDEDLLSTNCFGDETLSRLDLSGEETPPIENHSSEEETNENFDYMDEEILPNLSCFDEEPKLYPQEKEMYGNDQSSTLSDILQRNDDSSEFSVVIKVFISKILSRLACTSSGWHLSAKISDDTSTIEANFDDKVLENLVGVSAKDMRAMQVQGQENVDIKNKITQLIGDCRKKLQSLKCPCEIRFSASDKPLVIKIFHEVD